VQPALTNEALGVTVPSYAEEIVQNMPVQGLKGGNPTTELLSSRLVTHPRELNIISSLNVQTSVWQI